MTPSNITGRDDLIGCPHCDLLIKRTNLKKGYDLICPRCKTVLVKSYGNSMDKTMAFSLSGLFLFFPACFLPLLDFSVLGYTGRCTMVKAAFQMFDSGYLWMGFLVLFCSILVPFAVLLILFSVSLSVRMGKYPKKIMGFALKTYHHLTEWTMLDVYMIGILVSLIKMRDYGDIFSGLGLYSFVGLLAMVILSMISFDPAFVWERMEGRS